MALYSKSLLLTFACPTWLFNGGWEWDSLFHIVTWKYKQKRLYFLVAALSGTRCLHVGWGIKTQNVVLWSFKCFGLKLTYITSTHRPFTKLVSLTSCVLGDMGDYKDIG